MFGRMEFKNTLSVGLYKDKNMHKFWCGTSLQPILILASWTWLQISWWQLNTAVWICAHTHMIKCVWWYACSLVAMTLMDTSDFTWCGLRVCVLLLHPESCLWTKVPPKREWVTNLFQPHVDAAPLTWSLFVGAPRWRAASGCHHI